VKSSLVQRVSYQKELKKSNLIAQKEPIFTNFLTNRFLAISLSLRKCDRLTLIRPLNEKNLEVRIL